MKHKILTIILLFTAISLLYSQTLQHPWWVVDRGGGKSTGGGLTLQASIGQTAIQKMTVDTFALESGYLPGLRNLSGTLLTYSITGYVSTSAGTGISGAVMNGLPGNPNTDANGYYTGTVDYGWSGTVTPTKTGYSFSPPSTTYSSVTSNRSTDYTGTGPTSVEQISQMIPDRYLLSQNYPNPFNPITTIEFSIPKSTFITLKVYNTLGLHIETIVNQNINAGRYRVHWDGLNLPSGVYFYQIQSSEFVDTKKLLLLR